jgi:hypothetical protein
MELSGRFFKLLRAAPKEDAIGALAPISQQKRPARAGRFGKRIKRGKRSVAQVTRRGLKW